MVCRKPLSEQGLDVTALFNYQNPWHRHLRLWSYPLSDQITLSLVGSCGLLLIVQKKSRQSEIEESPSMGAGSQQSKVALNSEVFGHRREIERITADCEEILV